MIAEGEALPHINLPAQPPYDEVVGRIVTWKTRNSGPNAGQGS